MLYDDSNCRQVTEENGVEGVQSHKTKCVVDFMISVKGVWQTGRRRREGQ